MRKFGSSYLLSAELAGDRDIRKTASTTLGVPQQRIYKESHKADFSYIQKKEGYLYTRNRAISSRINENFDQFDHEELKGTPDGKLGYLTFIGKPVFVNHVNSNHRRARGVNVAAALHEDYNPDGSRDTWVELYKEVDSVKFPKLVQAILAGHIDRTSMGCFLPNTPITLSDGTQKPIKNIRVGDKILTHTGKIEDVKYVMVKNHNDIVYDISTYGESSKFILTAEHPVWIRRKAEPLGARRRKGIAVATKCSCGRDFPSRHSLGAHIRESKRRNWSDVHEVIDDVFEGWVKAEDIKMGDMVLTPHLNPQNEIKGNKDFATLLGYYIAEGNMGWDWNRSSDPVTVEWNLHEDEIEYIDELRLSAKRLGYELVGPYPQKSNGIVSKGVSVRVNSPKLAKMLRHFGGEYSWGKKLHPDVMRLDIESQREILRTYLNGDAHIGQRIKQRNFNTKAEAGTASKKLAQQLHLIAIRCGYVMVPPTFQHSPSTKEKGHLPKYVLQTIIERDPRIKIIDYGASVDEKGLWRKVSGIQIKEYKGKVYNFDVDGDDSYIASDIGVHNCDVVQSTCSKCGNIAYNESEYCVHIPQMKGARFSRFDQKLGKVESILSEICGGLSFFEDSYLVEPPADPTAVVLGVEKVGTKNVKKTSLYIPKSSYFDLLQKELGNNQKYNITLNQQQYVDQIRTQGVWVTSAWVEPNQALRTHNPDNFYKSPEHRKDTIGKSQNALRSVHENEPLLSFNDVRGDTKQDINNHISEDLIDRIHSGDHKDLHDWARRNVNYQGYAPDNVDPHEELHDALRSKVRDVIDNWKDTSADHHFKSIAFQIAAKNHFGLRDETLSHIKENTENHFDDNGGRRYNFDDNGHYNKKSTWDKANQHYEENKPFYHHFIDSVYNHTQEKLKDTPYLHLHRGHIAYGAEDAHSSIHPTKDPGPRGEYGAYPTPEPEPKHIGMQPFSSWSTNPQIAKDFARGNHGHVFESVVPREHVFSLSSSTGPGCLSEREALVIGGHGKAKVHYNGRGWGKTAHQENAKFEENIPGKHWTEHDPDSKTFQQGLEKSIEKHEEEAEKQDLLYPPHHWSDYPKDSTKYMKGLAEEKQKDEGNSDNNLDDIHKLSPVHSSKKSEEVFIDTYPHSDWIKNIDSPDISVPIENLEDVGMQDGEIIKEGKYHFLVKTSYNETIVPPEVNTTRDTTCPVCGYENVTSNVCPNCSFAIPPDNFTDPDTSIAQQLRQNQDQDQMLDPSQEQPVVPDLVCPNCGSEFSSSDEFDAEGDPHLAPAANVKSPEQEAADEVEEEEAELEAGEFAQPGTEIQTGPDDIEGDKDADSSEYMKQEDPNQENPEMDQEEVDPEAEEEQAEAEGQNIENTGYQVGDTCPVCDSAQLEELDPDEILSEDDQDPEDPQQDPQEVENQQNGPDSETQDPSQDDQDDDDEESDKDENGDSEDFPLKKKKSN